MSFYLVPSIFCHQIIYYLPLTNIIYRGGNIHLRGEFNEIQMQRMSQELHRLGTIRHKTRHMPDG